MKTSTVASSGKQRLSKVCNQISSYFDLILRKRERERGREGEREREREREGEREREREREGERERERERESIKQAH